MFLSVWIVDSSLNTELCFTEKVVYQIGYLKQIWTDAMPFIEETIIVVFLFYFKNNNNKEDKFYFYF